MLKLSFDEFKEEIKAEMYGYEEIEEKDIERWFNTLKEFVDARKKSDIFSYEGDSISVKLRDESDFFMIVDRYLAAIVNEDMDKYYTDWKL